MQYIRDGKVYKAIRITGPSHNLLGIALARGGDDEEVIVEVLDTSSGDQQVLDADEVRQFVDAGVEEANKELGTRYRATIIQFVPSDSPPAEIYKMMAKSIVERVAQGGQFSDT